MSLSRLLSFVACGLFSIGLTLWSMYLAVVYREAQEHKALLIFASAHVFWAGTVVFFRLPPRVWNPFHRR